MYALKSVEKFINDNKDRLGEKQVKKMLERAREEADNGVLSGGSIEKIMLDNSLADEYHHIAIRDTEHFEITMSALHNQEKH